MAKSKSKNSNSVSIISVVVNNINDTIGHIHKLEGSIGFSGNITNVYGTLDVKVYDTVLGVEEDISYSLTTHSPTTEISYLFDYADNTNIDILTPSIPPSTVSNQWLRVYLNSVLIHDAPLNVDSCRKYFDPVYAGGAPAFTTANFDFDSTFNFDFTSYLANSDDTLKMYCVGQTEGITQLFTTTVTDGDNKGSTATLDYAINSSSGTLNDYSFTLSSVDDVLLEIEKVGYDHNTIFTIKNAEPSTVVTKVYMDNLFDEIQIPYDTPISIQYIMYYPLWEGLTGLNPILSFTGGINNSGAITDAYLVENIGTSSIGKVVFNVDYNADESVMGSPPPPTTGIHTIPGNAIITLGGFQMVYNGLSFEIVVP